MSAASEKAATTIRDLLWSVALERDRNLSVRELVRLSGLKETAVRRALLKELGNVVAVRYDRPAIYCLSRRALIEQIKTATVNAALPGESLDDAALRIGNTVLGIKGGV